MGAFEYQAIDAEGKTQKGLIEADTAKQARQQLRGMSLICSEKRIWRANRPYNKAAQRPNKLNR